MGREGRERWNCWDLVGQVHELILPHMKGRGEWGSVVFWDIPTAYWVDLWESLPSYGAESGGITFFCWGKTE